MDELSKLTGEHQDNIRRKQMDIEYLKENKQLNRDRKINDLIPEY